MSEHDAILFANEAFYRAFADRDVAAMEALWAQSAPVCCIHPGWEAIHGHDDVLSSWRAILTGSSPPRIACISPQAYFFGDAAFVVCFEGIDGNYLIATNYFVREGGRWRMVHHQAGPTRFTPDDLPPAETPSIN